MICCSAVAPSQYLRRSRLNVLKCKSPFEYLAGPTAATAASAIPLAPNLPL